MGTVASRVSVEDARQDLGELAERVRAGETFDIVSGNQVIAELRPPLHPRRVGCMRGSIRVVGDDLAATTDEWPEVR